LNFQNSKKQSTKFGGNWEMTVDNTTE